MKKRNIFGIAAVLMVLTVFSTIAQAQDSVRHQQHNRMTGSHSFHKVADGKMNHHGEGRLAFLPNITPEQQKKIDALQTPFQKDVLGLRNQIAEKEAHLQTLQTADKADLTAVNKTIDEVSALRSQLMKRSASHREDFRKLLTDEQRVAFDSRSAHGNWHHRGGKKF